MLLLVVGGGMLLGTATQLIPRDWAVLLSAALGLMLLAWEVGDTIPDGPPGTAFFTVAALEPQRSLALFSTTHILLMAPASVRNNTRLGLYGIFSWVFVLDEQAEDVTRLIVRTRASYGPLLFRMLTLPLFYPGDFLMALPDAAQHIEM